MSLAARANEIQHGEWKLQYYNIYRGYIVVIMHRDVQGFHLQDLKNWVVSYADLKIEMVSSRNKTLNTFSL